MDKPKIYEVFLSKYSWYGSIFNFFYAVKLSGYPYFEWNNRIFKIDSDHKSFSDTEYIWENEEIK